MSSPASRRSNRNSVNGTPRRSSTRGSETPISDPPLPDSDAANDQLQSEADQASQNTPRADAQPSQNTSQSQAPPTSSPLFFRSSPAGSQSQSQSQSLGVPAGNGINISSPLRQQSDAASSQGGRTPRPSGGIGGERPHRPLRRENIANRASQIPRRSTTRPALTLQNLQPMDTAQIGPFQVACLFARPSRVQQRPLETDGTISTLIY